jgi:DNA-binding NarL/FixJ family response regulator
VQQIRIVLADDHPTFRQGLVSLLAREGFSIAAEGSDGNEAITLAEKFRPDILILDLSMPGMNGLDAAKEARRVSPRTKTILVTVHREEQYVIEAIAAGIKGYVCKSEIAHNLAEAIRQVYRGAAFFSPLVAQFAPDAAILECAHDNVPPPSGPNERERSEAA